MILIVYQGIVKQIVCAREHVYHVRGRGRKMESRVPRLTTTSALCSHFHQCGSISAKLVEYTRTTAAALEILIDSALGSTLPLATEETYRKI